MSVSQKRPVGGVPVRFSKPDAWTGSPVRFIISPVGGVVQCPVVARPLNCGASSVRIKRSGPQHCTFSSVRPASVVEKDGDNVARTIRGHI